MVCDGVWGQEYGLLFFDGGGDTVGSGGKGYKNGKNLGHCLVGCFERGVVLEAVKFEQLNSFFDDTFSISFIFGFFFCVTSKQ